MALSHAAKEATPLKERIYNSIWGLGARTMHMGKRLGISGPFERVLEQMATRLMSTPSKEVEVSIGDDMKLVIPPGFPRARTYLAGRYEPEVTALFRDTVKRGMSVVDIGAFCGYYAVLSSRLAGPSGRVYAFEVDPGNHKYLVRNLEANGCANVVPVNKAVFRSTGRMSMAFHAEADHHWVSDTEAGPASTTVETVSLDDFFAAEGWPSVGLVKMDIEGGELAALEGMRELVRRNPDLKIIMEYDLENLRRAGASRESLGAVLQELGFSEGYVIEQGMKPFRVPDGLPRTRATYDLLLRSGATSTSVPGTAA